MPQRLHAFVEHTDDDDPVTPVPKLFAKIIDDMHGSAATPSGYFDVQRAQARRKVLSRSRTRTVRLHGGQLDRSCDQRGVSPPLHRPELARGLP